MTKTANVPDDFYGLEDITFPLTNREITFQGDPKAYTLDLAKRWVDGDNKYEASCELLRECVHVNYGSALELLIKETGGNMIIHLATALVRYWRTGLLPGELAEGDGEDVDPKGNTPEPNS